MIKSYNSVRKCGVRWVNNEKQGPFHNLYKEQLWNIY